MQIRGNGPLVARATFANTKIAAARLTYGKDSPVPGFVYNRTVDAAKCALLLNSKR